MLKKLAIIISLILIVGAIIATKYLGNPKEDVNSAPVVEPTEDIIPEEIPERSISISKQADLNHDGKMDNIKLELSNIPTSDYFFHGTLTINDVTAKIDSIENPQEDLGIIDLDKKDNFSEIVYTDEGPSNDYVTVFFRYDGKSIHNLGGTPGPWQGFKVDGTGIFATRARGEILDTWFYYKKYKISDAGKLLPIAENFYKRLDNQPITMLQELSVQKSPTDPTTAFVLKKGEIIEIPGCDNIKWCLVKNSSGQEGWFAMHDYYIIVGPEKPANEVFFGLSYAD